MQNQLPYVNFGEFHRDEKAAIEMTRMLPQFYCLGYRTVALEFYSPAATSQAIEDNLKLKMQDILEIKRRVEASLQGKKGQENWCEEIIHSPNLNVLLHKEDNVRGGVRLLPQFPPIYYELLTQYRHTRAHLELVVTARELGMNVVGVNDVAANAILCRKVAEEAIARGEKNTDFMLHPVYQHRDQVINENVYAAHFKRGPAIGLTGMYHGKLLLNHFREKGHPSSCLHFNFMSPEIRSSPRNAAVFSVFCLKDELDSANPSEKVIFRLIDAYTKRALARLAAKAAEAAEAAEAVAPVEAAFSGATDEARPAAAVLMSTGPQAAASTPAHEPEAQAEAEAEAEADADAWWPSVQALVSRTWSNCVVS